MVKSDELTFLRKSRTQSFRLTRSTFRLQRRRWLRTLSYSLRPLSSLIKATSKMGVLACSENLSSTLVRWLASLQMFRASVCVRIWPSSEVRRTPDRSWLVNSASFWRLSMTTWLRTSQCLMGQIWPFQGRARQSSTRYPLSSLTTSGEYAQTFARSSTCQCLVQTVLPQLTLN